MRFLLIAVLAFCFLTADVEGRGRRCGGCKKGRTMQKCGSVSVQKAPATRTGCRSCR